MRLLSADWRPSAFHGIKKLPDCLESVRGLFDEIVVLDTGIKDRTIDFAAARDAASARAKGEYAFWLDADDLIEPPEREMLQALLERLRGDRPGVESSQQGTGTGILGRSQSPFASAGAREVDVGGRGAAFVVRCKCDPGPDGSGGETVVDHFRLFPVSSL